MRKRFHQRVCSCSPKKGMEYLESRMLNRFVNHGVHTIRCAASPHKFHRGLLLGDLCAEGHHLMWAVKVWKLTLCEIHRRDWDDFIDVNFDTKYVRLDDVISEGSCEVLGRRIDEAERRLGLSNPRYGSWEHRAGVGEYDWLRLWKYDYSLQELEEEEHTVLAEARSREETRRIFDEGLSESTPQPVDAFDYWHEDNEEKLKELR